MHNLLVTMSGGTTTVINATLAGIIRAVQKSKKIDKVYAGIPGILGVLNHNIVDLTSLSLDELEKLRKTPSSGVIGTTRVKQFDSKELNSFRRLLKHYEISYFINIGGNGTIKQTKYLIENMSEIKAISLPKTVDNDLGDERLESMIFTPGFPSVVNYWYHKVLMLNNENLGACSHDKVLIAQTFGRDTGFIAGAARMADPKRELPLLILLPEDQRPIYEVINAIKSTVGKFGRAIIVMAEGYKVGDVGAVCDYTGQPMYSSSKNLAAQLLVNLCVEAGIQARAFIPGVDQRSDITFTTEFDSKHAHGIGSYAVEQLDLGNHGFLAALQKIDHQICYTQIPFSSLSNYSRKLHSKFINRGAFDVSDAYLEYLSDVASNRKPLILKEVLDLNSFYQIPSIAASA